MLFLRLRSSTSPGRRAIAIGIGAAVGVGTQNHLQRQTPGEPAVPFFPPNLLRIAATDSGIV
jgi:hypothetical protein